MPQPIRLWNKSFTLLWQGQFVSYLGKSAFALTALLWLKDATGSGTLSGLLGGLAMLPMVLLGPVAGVFVDRVNRGRMIAWTDVAGGVLLSGAAVLFVFRPADTPLLLAAVFVATLGTGLLDTFSQPSIAASIPDLVPKERLEAANGLNMSGMQLAMLLSQGAAGILYVSFGAPFLVAANAAAYLWAGFTELGVRTPDLPARHVAGEHPWRRFLRELAEGLRFVWKQRGLRTSLIVFTVLNFFVTPLLALMAFLVEDYLGLGPQWMGYLMAAFGVGGIVGFLLGGVIRLKGRARAALVGGATIGQSATIVGMLVFTHPAAEAALCAAAGILGGIMNVHFMTLIQTAAPTELRGRVQSVSTTLSAGVMPLGMALSGILFDVTGGNFPLVIGLPGALMLAVSALALLVPSYRSFLEKEAPAA